MGDVIRLEQGFSPWQPASDARLVKEYAYYEVPLSGIIEQHGVRYYFHCVDGDDEPVSLWFYMRVNAEDEARLDAATADDFSTAVDFHGPGMLALAIEGPGVVATYLMDPLSTEAIREGCHELVRQLEDLTETAKELAPT